MARSIVPAIMISRVLGLLGGLLVAVSPVVAGTTATLKSSVGDMEIEFYDDDKPVTVSNFLKYVASGRFNGMFWQRWDTANGGFVVQAGGYRVSNENAQQHFRTVQTYGQIVNEYKVGRTLSNTYGTIAMARLSGGVNSATSQWFINLGNNAFLDTVDEGFTVFARVISGFPVLERFKKAPGTDGIFITELGPGYNAFNELIYMNQLPVREIAPQQYDVIYLQVANLRRDFQMSVQSTPAGRSISWKSVAGASNAIEVSDTLPGTWTHLGKVVGTGATMTLPDPSTLPFRYYRARVDYAD